jgi:hypothetical protein
VLDVIVEAARIRIGPRFALTLHRTLRIPDDGRLYPLPPGLGTFPIRRVTAHSERVPAEWRRAGGAFIPMYQREALWLAFHGAAWKPNAVKVAIGGVNALTGEPDGPELRQEPQNYLVAPLQPWLDGIKTGQGSVRQFVAMPLGQNYTVEAALTGQERHGGIQVTVFEPRPGIFPDAPPTEAPAPSGPLRSPSPGMGLGAGGAMRQKVYPDPYGIEVWDPDSIGSVVVHIVDSRRYREVTGEEPPPTPIDAATYTTSGLPWFDLYDEGRDDIQPSDRLTGAATIAARDAERGRESIGSESVDIPEPQVKTITPGPAKDDRGTRAGSSPPTHRETGGHHG